VEAAQQLHPHPCRPTLDDPRQELVLLGHRQAGHPSGKRVRIVGDLVERRGCLGRDGEQVVVEATA